MILYINACTRKESRTKYLAERFIDKSGIGEVEELNLYDVVFPCTDEKFLDWRNGCVERGDFSDKYFDLAKQFAAAEKIIIAAPYWDLSFPAVLKQYIEHINVMGITFIYTDEGYPKAMCRADKLYYITTAGGEFLPMEFGFGYIKSLAESFYGITDCELIMAKGLDVVGANVEEILENAI